jgi:predicted AlkP superfamily phosphohydrolase/phosphomutase
LWSLSGGPSDQISADVPSPAVRELYRALDCAIGNLVQSYANKANLLIFSGHGMARDYRPHWIVDELLEHFNLRIAKKTSSSSSKPGLQTKRPSLKRSERLVRLELRLKQLFKQSAPATLTDKLHLMLQSPRNVDYRRSVAWSLPTDHQGFVRLNVKGREPDGIVDPKCYVDTIEDIAMEFEGLTNAHSGKSVVEEVFRIHELYPEARRANALPDIAIAWRNEPVEEVETRSGERLRVSPPPSDIRAANHQLSGFCFAIGPDIEPYGSSRKADLMDLGPTALDLSGIAKPETMQGRSLLETP